MSPWISEDRLLAVEERRFVVLLGILTIFVAYRDHLPNDFPYPLPYPFPHLQIFVLPVFDRFVEVFGLYAVFMFAYFSEDKLSDWLRIRLRRLAWATLFGYWAYFLYISSGLLGSIFVHDDLLVLYLLAFGLGFMPIAVALFEYTWGGKRWIRSTIRFYFSLYVTLVWLWTLQAFDTRLGRTRLAVGLRRFLSTRFRTPLVILRTKLRPFADL